MITFVDAVILGIVEGFTEFLPISSTAHLILAGNMLSIIPSEFAKTFEIAIQSGAILAVVALYGKRFLDGALAKKVIVAFVPTGILGLLFYKVIKTYLLGSTAVVLVALAVGGLLLIIFERTLREDAATGEITTMTYRQAAYIGCFQAIAMIPGVSRAAATIVGGMLLGFRREAIVEFSFLLAVPTMLAATGLDLAKNIHAFSGAELQVLGIGFIVSFITALLGIAFLLRYVRRHSFTAFGIYRIILVVLFLFLPHLSYLISHI